MPQELTIEQLQAEIEAIKEHPTYGYLKSLYKQLLTAMRQEAKLRETLTIIDMQALNVMQDDVSSYGAILKCGWVHEKCKEALISEYPVVNEK